MGIQGAGAGTVPDGMNGAKRGTIGQQVPPGAGGIAGTLGEVGVLLPARPGRQVFAQGLG